MSLTNFLGTETLNPSTNLPKEGNSIDKALSKLSQISSNDNRFAAPIETGAFLTSKYDTDLAYYENQAAQRAERQSGINQFGNFLNQAIVGEIIGGTIEGIGYLTALDDASKVATNKEADLGNFLTEAGKSIKQWTKDVTPIYETSPGEFAPGNWSWWMSNGPSVASTLSLLIPAAGVVRGVSAVGKVAGISGAAAKTARVAGMSARNIELAKRGITGISQAIVSRHLENMMESSGKYDEIYERNLRDGRSAEEARKNASVAASDIYKKNWLMLTQDIPQYMLLGRTFGKASKELTPKLAGLVGKSAIKTRAGIVGRYALDALSEGGEEAYQYVVGEMADDLSRSKLDPDYRPRQLHELTDDAEFWNSTAMGMLGSAVFQTAGRTVNKIIGGSDEQARIQNVKSHGPILKLYSNIMREAEEAGDITSFEEAKQGLINTLSTKAAELGNIDLLETNLNQILEQEATPEVLEEFGISQEDVEYIKENFPVLIEQVKEVGILYEKYAQGAVDNTVYDPDIAATLAGLETSKSRLNANRGELETNLKNSISALDKNGFNRMSNTGQDLIINEATGEALNKVKKFLSKRLKNKELSKEITEFYENKLKETNDKLDSIISDRKGMLKPDVYTSDKRKQDKNIKITPAMLIDVSSAQTAIEYSDMAISKKDEAIKETKQLQRDRKEGKVKLPQEPEPTSEIDVPVETPVKETTHEDTPSTPGGTTVVETKEYEPSSKDIAARRDTANNRDGLTKYAAEYGANTLNEIFDEFESVDVMKDRQSNTGILKKEGDRLYFYSDNEQRKIDVTDKLDIQVSESGFLPINDPVHYESKDPAKNKQEVIDSKLDDNELKASSEVETQVKHPDIDSKTEADIVDRDTNVHQGEVKVFYSFDKDIALSDYLLNPDNDITDAVGEYFIDYDNETFPADTKQTKLLREGKLDKLSQDFIDSILLGINLTNQGEKIPGIIYLPRGTTVPPDVSNKEDYITNTRTIRSKILKELVKGNNIITRGFRKDSGMSWNTPNKGSKNNILKSLNMSLDEIRLGVAVKDGAIYDRDNNPAPAFSNVFGGSVYLITDRTPNNEIRVPKLNKSKISSDHANIILNAFQQSLKGWKTKYEGSEVTADINVGDLLGLLVFNGDKTIITQDRKELIGDVDYIERLEKNQLYRSGKLLKYGKSGSINLDSITPEDRKNFIEYATKNFNYPIILSKLKDKVSDKFTKPTKIGSWDITQDDIDNELTFEQHYVKNSWVTTDLEADKYGNITSRPFVYSNNSSLEQVKKDIKLLETKPKSDKTIDDILNPFRPYTSKYYKGELYVKTNIDNQIKQITDILGENVPITVVNDFIKVVDETGSHLAFGQVKDYSIKLYNKAEIGTGYHEAFHIVSLYYLTDKQRDKVYDEASKYYKINRTDKRAIEESLAEAFRNYMLSDKRITPKQKEIRNFFQRLYDFIIGLFVNPVSRVSDLSIEKLFDAIEKGEFKKAKASNANLKKYSGYDYLRRIENFSTEQTNHIADLLMHQMLTKNNIVKLEDVGKLSLDPVINYLKDLINTVNINRKDPSLNKDLINELDRLYDVYSRILDNFDEFTVLISDRLTAMNIRRKPESFEHTEGIDMFNIFVDSKDGSEINKFDTASYEVSGKDNLLANVKLFIATLPAYGEEDTYTRMPKILDFSEAYTRIMMDLHDAKDFEEIIKILEQKSNDKVYGSFYKVLLDGSPSGERIGLKNAPLSFKNQFEIAVAKHRHEFVNVVRDFKTGEHNIYEASISKIEKELAYEWSLNFFLSNKFINEDDTVKKDKITQVIKGFNERVKQPVNKDYSRDFFLEDYNNHLDRIVKALDYIGINVSIEDIQNVITELGTDEQGNLNESKGMHTLVNELLEGIFGTSGSLTLLLKDQYIDKKRPESVLASDNKVIELARMVISDNTHYITDTVLGAQNNTYYVYSQPTLLSHYVKQLNKDSKLIKELKTVTGNESSRFIKQIEDGRSFNIATLASYRNGYSARDYTDISPESDFLFKLHSTFRNLLPLPTLADRKAYFLYKGFDRLNLGDSYVTEGKYYISDTIVDVFYSYAKDEQTRIAKVKKDIADAKENGDYSKLYKNKHYRSVNEQGVPLFEEDVNGLRYHHFTSFNKYNEKGKFIGTISPSKEAIRKALRKNVIDSLEYANNLGIVQIRKDNKGAIIGIKNKKISNTLVSKYTQQYGSETLSIFHILSDYTLNTIMSTVETEKILTMDPTYYKGIEDKIKRLTALAAPGDKLIDVFTEGEFINKSTYTSGIVRSFNYSDKKLMKQLYYDFTKAYKKDNPNASREEIKRAVDIRVTPYENIDVTDGQTFVTPRMYRELKHRMGEWEQSQENAYNILFGDKRTTDKEQILEAQKLIMQPLKLIHYGPYFRNNDGIPIYDKMSVAVITPDVVKGTILEPLYNHMIENDIDMLKYDSAVKTGTSGMVNYFNKDGSASPSNLEYMLPMSQDFKYLRKQQVTDPHDSETRKLGTQVQKIAMLNLKLDESIYNIKGSKRTYTGREIGKMFSKAYASLSSTGRRKVEKALAIDSNGNISKEKLLVSLRHDAQQSNMPYNIIDSLKVDDEGKPYVQLDTLLNRNWTQSRMISMVTKNTIDIVTSGTDLIQMSGGGLSINKDGGLQLTDSKGRTEIKVSVSLFKGIIPNYEGKTFEDKIRWLKLNVRAGYEGIGYRIPTQAQSSTIPFVIREFLPESYGNTVILPYSFTTLTGSDFDIDKLFIARYNYYYIGDRIRKYNFHEGDEEGKITNEETLRKIYSEFTIPKLNLRDNLIELRDKIEGVADTKKALFDAWTNIVGLSTKVQVAEEIGYDTITDEVLSKVGLNMTYEHLNELIDELLQLPTIEEFVEENKGKDAFYINHKKAVQNRLIDLMFSVLTNEAHILDTKTPLDTFTGKLRNMSKYVRVEEELGMLEGASPSYQLKVKNWYMGGKDGIGPFALNNVHHALTQLTGYTFEQGGLTYDLTKQKGQDNVGIIDWLSALINAHVDIAKDPYIFHLNVNDDTYDVVNLLIRSGYGENTFWFINQEAIKNKWDVTIALQKAEELASKISKSQEEYITRKEEIKDIIKEYSNPDIVLKDKDLQSYIKEDNKDYKYYAKQAGITNAYIKIKTAGDYLKSIVLASRIDTKGFGKTLGDIKLFQNNFEKLTKLDSKFANLINETHLGTMYNNSVIFIQDIYKELLIDSTTAFEEIVDMLSNKLGVPVDTVSKALYSSIIATYFSSANGYNLSKEDINKLFIGKTSLGYRLRNISERYPHLGDNKFIKTLKSVLDRNTNIWFIKSLSGDKNDKDLRDSYSDAWGDLLTDSNPEIQQIGKDLIYYSFYTSGFNKSLYSFYQDIPIEKLRDKPDHNDGTLVKSFDEFVTDMLALFNSNEIPSEIYDRLISETLKTLDVNLVEEYTGPAATVVDQNNKVIIYKFKSDSTDFLGSNLEGLPIFKQMYTYNDPNLGQQLVEYVGYKQVSKEVIYKVLPRTGVEYKGHKLFEFGYEGSIVKGNFAEVSEEFLRDKLNTLAGFNDFVYVSQENRDAFIPDIKSDVEETIDIEAEVIKEQQIALPMTKESIGSLVYNNLGEKTVSNNVRIERWAELKDLTKATTDVQGTVVHVIATRIKNSNEHFGNPFSSDERVLKQNPSLIKTNSTKESVEKYIEWVINSNDERAQWIREQIDYGDLKDKPILYYKELGEPSHATALDYLINKYDWAVKQDPFLSEEQVNLIKQIPTGEEFSERTEELRNAAVNMDVEEFRNIVEQIRSCNG